MARENAIEAGVDEFIQFSGQACAMSYQDWLN